MKDFCLPNKLHMLSNFFNWKTNFLFFFFFAAPRSTQDLSSPNQGSNPHPLQWNTESFFFLLNKFIYSIYLFLAALGLLCCVLAFSSCRKRGLLFVAVPGLLIAVASLVAEHGL